MLWPASLLMSCRIGATDGEVGRVRDLLLGAGHWGLRSLVVDAGWSVLISPRVVAGVDPDRRLIRASLTTSQVAASPRVDTDKTAQSARELSHHYVQGLDREIGRVTDLLLDDRTWAITHLVVAAESVSAERTVLIPVGWVSWVSWHSSSVVVALRSDRLAAVPDYDPSCPLTPFEEPRLVAGYGRPPFPGR